ncbi:MAG: hypothetical protein IJF71_04305, partial [Clostridia bacterium]|nr:hypothetical protein [Clostridia bacterium]
FTDEPQYSHHPISDSILKGFQQKAGYPLCERLYLFEEDTAEGRAFRKVYFDTVTELFQSNYVRKLDDWCTRNGLLLTGHFPEEDGLSTQFLKGGDTMYNYLAMQYPGIDMLGKRLTSPLLLKQIGSVMAQRDLKYVLSESFGCAGWNTSFADYLWLWGYEASFGVNTACIHLSPYSIRGVRKRDYPGFFGYQTSWWSRMHLLSEYMESINSFVSQGSPAHDVLVIAPVTSCYGEVAYGNEARILSTQLRTLLEGLMQAQIGFDISNENVLKELGLVKDGALYVGKCAYKRVILSYCRSISRSLFALLKQMEENGVEVVFTSNYPSDVEGDSLSVQAWLKAFEKEPFGGVVQNRAALWQKYFESKCYERKVSLLSFGGAFVKDVSIRYTEEEGIGRCFVMNTSTCDRKESVLCFNGRGTVYEYDLQTKKKTNITASYGNGCTRAEIALLPKQCKAFVFEEGVYKCAEQKMLQMRYAPALAHTRLTHSNSFTVDRASCSVAGEPFGTELPLVDLQKDLFAISKTLSKGVEACVRYCFEAEYIPDDLCLWLEDATVSRITVNGKPFIAEQGRWFIDKEIRGGIVAGLCKKGKNEVILHYELKPPKNAIDLDTVFESEKNRFSYDAEIEPIYLTGSFDVVANGAYEKDLLCYRVEDKGFKLSACAPKNMQSDLTPQGLWFYRGDMIKEYAFRYEGGSVTVSLFSLQAALATVQVNGKEAGMLLATEELDITEHLQKGENRVTLTVCGTNRNLMGPHHHYKGEPQFVGVNTFNGTRGYEDGIVDYAAPEKTSVAEYAFVPFGAGQMYISVYSDIHKTEK